jgi:oligosaccharide translocation protein RFT1
VYAAVLVVCYYGFFLSNPRRHGIAGARAIFPQGGGGSADGAGGGRGWLNAAQCSLVGSFLRQSGLKQVLTEGERYMMTFLPMLSFR